MKLRFLGATHEVTGSCTLVEINGRYGLVDCGMEQGEDIFVNQKIPVDAEKIDFVLLTHAHIDHSGNLPLLVKNGFSGTIYATSATYHLSEIMLLDCAHIQESEAEWTNRKNERAGRDFVDPLYTTEDAQNTLRLFRPCEYGERIRVAEGLDVSFVDAGHLLGSASIELYLAEGDVEKKVVFSGDIGNFDQPIINDPTYISQADYVIMESTYGDRLHNRPPEGSVAFLAECIQRVLDRGGNVVIPSFAVGRTQEILYFIREVKQKNLVKGHDGFKVYVDSPMANETTAVFLQCDKHYFDPDMCKVLEQGVNPLMSPGVTLSVSTDESKAINDDRNPKVIISASGMCEAGRIRHHLKHNLWRRESMILFVGYQALGTTGRVIIEGAEKVKLFGEEIICKAEIAMLEGKSGHADKEGLTIWINSFEKKPEMVFINHGEDEVCASFAEYLHKEYGYETSAPFSGSEFDLIEGCYTELAQEISIESEKKKEKKERHQR